MNLLKSTRFLRYSSLLTILSLSTGVLAGDWSFHADNGEACALIATVNDKLSGKKIASLAMIKLGNDALNNISGFEREIIISDAGFILETKPRRLKVEKGAGVQVSSQTFNAYMSYIPNSREGSDDFVYTLSNTESLDMRTAIFNEEELTLEFNTISSNVQYGIITADNFSKSYKKFKQCTKTLDQV